MNEHALKGETMKFLTMVITIFFLFFYEVQDGYAYFIKGKEPYDYQQMKTDLGQLQIQYGELLEIKKIGESYFEKAIWAIKLGKGSEHIVLLGAHHGREWITTNLLMMMLERYANAYDKEHHFGPYDTKILDKVSIWFIPMVNPDGVDIQQGKIPKQFEKNLLKMNLENEDFSSWKANGIGIDLNRQYPAGWKTVPGSEEPCYKGYKGRHPLEAKEIKAIVKFIYDIKPKSAISYHSSGHEIYWRYGYHQQFIRDYFLAISLAELTGYKLAIPNKDAYGGGFTDWFISEFNKPAFTFELTQFNKESNPPVSDIKEEWKRNKYIGLYLATEMSK